MAGPGDEIAGTGSRGRLRASHADREQVIGTLKTAFVQGMLGKGEFDQRLGQAFAARTYADLAALTADLPAGLTAAQPPTSARAPDEARALWPGPVIMASTALCASVWGVALLAVKGDNHVVGLLVVLTTLTYFLVLLMAGGHMLASRLEKRSGGQLPRRPAPGAGDQASPRLAAADPGRQLPPGDHGRQHIAEAARRRFPGLPSRFAGTAPVAP